MNDIRPYLMWAALLGGIAVFFYINYRTGLPEYAVEADYNSERLPNHNTIQPWVVGAGTLCIAIFFGCILSYGNFGF